MGKWRFLKRKKNEQRAKKLLSHTYPRANTCIVLNLLLSGWSWLPSSVSTRAGLLWMPHWQTLPGARQLGTNFFCYSLLLMGCQFDFGGTLWRYLQERRCFSLMECFDPISKSYDLVASPLPAHLTFVHSFSFTRAAWLCAEPWVHKNEKT